jgi:hypothetical protein
MSEAVIVWAVLLVLAAGASVASVVSGRRRRRWAERLAATPGAAEAVRRAHLSTNARSREGGF